MQQNVDEIEPLQSLFRDVNPDLIANKLVEGFKTLTDLVVTKNAFRLQIEALNSGLKNWRLKEIKSMNSIKSQ